MLRKIQTRKIMSGLIKASGFLWLKEGVKKSRIISTSANKTFLSQGVT